MTPILFPPDAVSFATHGTGTLSDCSACQVTEERNGAFELKLRYPITGVHFGHIQQRSIILAKPNHDDPPQPFRVYRISRPIDGIVTIYAYHISYDLSGYPVRPYTAQNAQTAVAGLGQQAFTPSPFTITTNLTGTGAFNVPVPTATRALFGGTEGSLIDVYGGEWQYDGFACRLLQARGADKGVKIVYGKNLTDLKQNENCSSVYTAIVPYYAPSEGEAIIGDVIPAVENADYTKILPVDLSQTFDAEPTVAQLNSAGRVYLKTHAVGVPTVSLSVSFVSLQGADGYDGTLETVKLCDMVTVQFPRLGVDAKAKVVKTVYDCLSDRLTSVEIGSIRTNIADTIAAAAQEILAKPSAGVMEKAILSATKQITGGTGGYVVTRFNAQGKPYELLIMDTDNIDTAKNVWRWNSGGFGHSATGYNGPYSTAITQDGHVVANFVDTGELNADIIKSGTINALNINVTNINGENILGKTIANAQLADGAASERVIATQAVGASKVKNYSLGTQQIQTSGINNRCIASGSIYTSTCNSQIQGYFADVIETQKLYAGTAVVGNLRATYIKGDYFAFANTGIGHKLVWNGEGNPITGG